MTAENIRVAWWNLENLFDSANAQRDPELKNTLKGELDGWTVRIRNRKIAQISRIIKKMFHGQGPDLLGVCEVENERIVELLVNRANLKHRKYKVVTHESPDTRGIDVSFIVDTNVLIPSRVGHQVVVKRNATRDLFWVSLRVKSNGQSFTAIANHWPARSAGQYESEPFRMLTGETASYVLSRFLDPKRGGRVDLPVLMMGDFNDEPFNRSMREYLLGRRDSVRVSNARSPFVLNLMWPCLDSAPGGTFKFNSDWFMFDQFLVSKDMLYEHGPIRAERGSVEIFRSSELIGKGGGPRRFGRPSNNSLDRDGYSDHFPITMLIHAS